MIIIQVQSYNFCSLACCLAKTMFFSAVEATIAAPLLANGALADPEGNK